ncbi:uncharacterized protein OCT59_028823 [Rhizophagus irregularis]|uniref:F-box domain-containing protein n=2 Tax=Rhizophagus irregularis TaxID=588596 RepID=A0A015I5U7_RHIIW|nr:hypothetical protein RirG_253030 [Rhizophagus irregularis DAOM 197198w]UZO08569.1 hypothetical protein OCT59_028823 [Rhizophagus irregularis]
MIYQLSTLSADCLHEIFDHIVEDKPTLYSCLLVNRLWCKISVRILWRNIWNYKVIQQQTSLRTVSSILSTLIACLPNESKEILRKNKIFISTPTLKSPLFNYVAFCRVLSICGIGKIVDKVLRNGTPDKPRNLKNNYYIISNEIIKMFMNQNTLKQLIYDQKIHQNKFSFTCFLGVKDLSELRCSSYLTTDFFHRLSQTCHNLQLITIEFHNNEVSNELKEFISSQKKLKSLVLITYYNNSWATIIPTLKKHSNTLKKLHLYSYSRNVNVPLSFISSFTNLQEFVLGFYRGTYTEDFKKLQYAKFPKLQTLKIPYQCPNPEYVMKFLETNGNNLKNLYTVEKNNALSLSIAKFCPNLRRLFVRFNNGEIDILKKIFINCRYLESIKIWCGEEYLNEKEVFDTVVNYSPSNFCELKIYNNSKSDFVSPKDLESFFIKWKNRKSKKSLKLIFLKDSKINGRRHYGLDEFKENMKIIENYKNLGVIKFMTKDYIKEEEEEEVIENYYFSMLGIM